MGLKTATLFISICTVGFCCNSGWTPFRGSCYKVFSNVQEHSVGDNYCHTYRGSLAIAKGPDYVRFFNTLPDFVEQKEYWINDFGSWTEDPYMDKTETEKHLTCLYVKSMYILYEHCMGHKSYICEVKETGISCQTGYNSFGSMCLRAVSNPANYDDAAKLCALEKGELAVLDKQPKEQYAEAEVFGLNKTFLIGVRRKDNRFEWSTGEEFHPDAFFQSRYPVSWGYTAPNVTEGLDCVGIYSGKLRPLLPVFEYANCNDKSSFLCQTEPLQSTTTNSPSTPTPFSSTPFNPRTSTPTSSTPAPLQCPNGHNWRVFQVDEYCFWETGYYSERLNWDQAREFCKKYGGDLASYENFDQVMSGLRGRILPGPDHWIGLKRYPNDVFRWTDGTRFNFTNWDTRQPNLNSSSSFCVLQTAANLKWQLEDCEARLFFICKADKVSNSAVVEVTPETMRNATVVEVTPKTKEIIREDTIKNLWKEEKKECTCHRLTVGAIFGLVICVSVILTIAGVTVYCLWKTKKVQPKLVTEIESELL